MATRHVLALGVLFVLATACHDTTGPTFWPFEVVIESGDAQVAAAGDALPEPIVARLVRPDGTTRLRTMHVQLVDGGSVHVEGGGGGGGVGTTLAPSTLGMVTVTWVLPDEVGSHRLRFFAVQLNGDTVEGFATAEAQAP